MEEIKDRFKFVMNREGMTAKAFAEAIGISPSTVTHILNGRNKCPSTEVLLHLHNKYPDVTMDWLLFGKGQQPNTAAGLGSEAADLFQMDENAINTDREPVAADNRKETASEEGEIEQKPYVTHEIIYKERPARKITEIRIFFDDNTYETFIPS